MRIKGFLIHLMRIIQERLQAIMFLVKSANNGRDAQFSIHVAELL